MLNKIGELGDIMIILIFCGIIIFWTMLNMFFIDSQMSHFLPVLLILLFVGLIGVDVIVEEDIILDKIKSQNNESVDKFFTNKTNESKEIYEQENITKERNTITKKFGENDG